MRGVRSDMVIAAEIIREDVKLGKMAAKSCVDASISPSSSPRYLLVQLFSSKYACENLG
jgi:hypothetical protein